MSEQIDIAVDLGVVPPPLPEIMNLRQLVEAATDAAGALRYLVATRARTVAQWKLRGL